MVSPVGGAEIISRSRLSNTARVLSEDCEGHMPVVYPIRACFCITQPSLLSFRAAAEKMGRGKHSFDGTCSHLRS